MAEIFGENGFFYEYVEGWGQQLPDGMTFVECPGVAVDSNDTVYVLTRGEHPIIVFDKDGTYQRTFGEGWFSKTRTHGLYCAHDDTLLVADDGIHTIQKFGTDGTRLMEIGERDHPSPKWGGEPFNRPTSAAIRPSNGDIYISDGYGNARIHVYTGDGQYKFSWGSSGIDAGQFIRPHNIAIDEHDRVYVVDREPHRVQVFDAEGNFVTMWNNIHRPDSMMLWQDHIYIGELNGIAGVDDAPGLGPPRRHLRPGRQARVPLRQPGGGQRPRPVRRAPRHHRGLGGQRLRSRGQLHHPRQPHDPAAGAAEHKQVHAGVGQGVEERGGGQTSASVAARSGVAGIASGTDAGDAGPRTTQVQPVYLTRN